MTDQPLHPDSAPAEQPSPQSSPPTSPRRPRRRWPWLVALALVLGLGGLVAYSPALFGSWLLSRLDSAGVSAEGLGGPIWSPNVQGAAVNLPGIQVTAGSAQAQVSRLDWGNKTLHLNVQVADAQVAVNLQELIGGQQGGGGAGGGFSTLGWKVALDTVSVQRTQLALSGQGVNVPDGQFTAQSQPDGRVRLVGRTAYGDVSADLRLNQDGTGRVLRNALVIDAQADARLINHYWPGGVSAGRVAARYVIGSGPIQGDLKLVGGVTQVPEAPFVRVTEVSGTASHRGDQISLKLAGRGWDGPVTAQGSVDLEAKHWTVTADATPTLAGLGRALGTTGAGGLKLRVTAGGWTDVRVKGDVQGEGELAGIPVRGAKGEYTLFKQHGVHLAQTNELAFSAQTSLAGAEQRLEGLWAFGRTGRASLVGELGQQPLEVRASIDAQNLVTLEGQGLGGPLSGTFALKGQVLQAVVNPQYGGVGARVALSGTPTDLRAAITDGQVGPFALAGRAALNVRGLQADLGNVQLDLNRQFRGTWAVQSLSGSGVVLDGEGRLDLLGGGLSGTLAAQVTGLPGVLRGPLNVNYLQRRGTFTAGAQRVRWQGEQFLVSLRELAVAGGAQVTGDVTLTTALQAFGNLRASGQGFELRAVAQGDTAQLSGTLGGVNLQASTRLSAPFATTARIQGSDIRGDLNVAGDGVNFTLYTAGQTARGRLSGNTWDATGRVNLAALRPVLGLSDLSGTLDLNLAGLGGTARVNALVSGAQVTGRLRRVGGPVDADLRVAYVGATPGSPGAGESLGPVSARLTGRVYPTVQASGTLTGSVAGGPPQTLRTVIQGRYGQLRAQVAGRSAPLTFGRVTFPAQEVNLSGSLTPKLDLTGTWGDLQLAYDSTSAALRVTGRQALLAFDQPATVQGRATLGTLRDGVLGGAVQASGTLDGYTLTVAGPWSDLKVTLAGADGLRAQGTASLPAATYDLTVRGPLAGLGLSVDGSVRGQGLEPRGTLRVTDRGGGRGLVTLRGLSDFDLSAQNLTVAGQSVVGRLQADNNLLSGELKAGPLTLRAANGLLRGTGELAGHQLVATGRLTLPATLSDLQVRVSGPYLSATASGDLSRLRGTLTTRAQVYGNDPLRLSVPAQTFPLSASLLSMQANVGGLSYQGGRWGGGLQARYSLSGRGGSVQVLGQGSTLSARPAGPVAGDLTLWPEFGGTLSANLAPLLSVLPADLRRELVAGQVRAQVTATGATFGTLGTRYLGDPLALTGQVSWNGGLRGSGVLTHPGSRLPVRYDGQHLTIQGASLDARTLRPFLGSVPALAELQGRTTLDLNVPDLNFGQASGRAQVNLSAQGQRAVGLLTVTGGQLSADLTSTLAGRALRVRGALYPQANATLSLDDLRATLTGQAQQTLRLQGGGTAQGRTVEFRVVGRDLLGGAAAVQVSGSVAGAALDATVQQGTVPQGTGAGLAAWKATGSLNIADLRPLANTTGSLSAVLSGTLADLRLNAAGEVAGVKFSAPASFRDGVLRLQGAAATLGQGTAIQGTAIQGTVRASGPIFPTLNLSAKATLTDLLPGQYTAQVLGTLTKPDLRVQGQLSGGLGGLQAAGTQLSARLLGQDWKVEFAGPALTGTARGRLGSQAQNNSAQDNSAQDNLAHSSPVLGGLQTARAQVNARFTATDTDLRLAGNVGWTARSGWLGHLRVVGDLPGTPLDAVFDGNGSLQLAALIGTGVRQARVTGTLPADLPIKPGGTLDLAAVDLGALWGRADELRLTGQATLGGASWNQLQARFAGRVQDRLDELSGDLGASYQAGDLSLRLAGPRVAGGGTLIGGRYALTLRAEPLRLARLIPQRLDVDALTAAGTLEASGTLTGGPERVLLRNLNLRGQQEQAGPFALYGTATYTPQTLSAALSGTVRGGVLRASGQLPQGVQLTIRDLDTALAGAGGLGQGRLGAALTLRGEVSDPLVQGTLSAQTEALDALLVLSGRALDPRVNSKVTLKKAASGTLYADLREVDWQTGRVRAHLYGALQSGAGSANVNLSGTWPELAGTVQARVAGLNGPVTLTGTGDGGYVLDSAELGGGLLRLLPGEGFVPRLTGNLSLSPLPLLSGSGELRVSATVAGSLGAPTLAASLISQGAAAYGFTLPDLTGSATGTLSALSGLLTQGGQTVATIEGQRVSLTGLNLESAGTTLSASGSAQLNGNADLRVGARGTVGGELRVTQQFGALAAVGQLSGPQDLQAAVDVRTDPYLGWRGTARITGGPQGALSAPLLLKVSGPTRQPLVQGEGGLLGAGARVIVTPRGAELRLIDGPNASASGVATLRSDQAGAWSWQGALSLTRPELSLSVTPSGPLADPTLLLSVRRGEWRASGTASLRLADLRVSDGQKDGTLSWRDGQLSTDLPGLSLARLALPDLSGTVTARGSVSTDTQDGQVTLTVSDLSTPYVIPYLNLPLSGDLGANVTLRAGRPSVQAVATLPAGTLNISAAPMNQPGTGQTGMGQTWTGQMTGQLSRQGGTLNVNIGAGGTGLTGTVQVKDYPTEVAGQALTVGGTLALQGQTFKAELTASNTLGQALVDASGGLADLLPALESTLGVKPAGEGYSVRVLLDELEISTLKLAPGLSGQITGQANISDGGGTVLLRSENLKVGAETLPARLSGTQVGSDWRISSSLGESEFRAGLSAGEVYGDGSLRSLPVGALLAAVAGTTPGEALVTGVVRFRFPLADPSAGTATVVAERVRVSATSGQGAERRTEVLTGYGTVDLANREVRSVNVQLSTQASSAATSETASTPAATPPATSTPTTGTWDVRGQYTRDKVDLTAQFNNTTFTPVLTLVPALADLNPSLKGTVVLGVSGTYDRPRATLRAQNLTGEVAGLSLQIPNFAGDLPDSGAFSGGGTLQTGGLVGSNGKLDVKGQLTLGQLSGTTVTFGGLLAPDSLGALPNTTAVLTQAAENRWIIDAQSRTPGNGNGAASAANGAGNGVGSGTLRLTGELTPRWNLTLTARNYNLPISAIYGRESALNADIRALDDGTVVRVSGAADFTRLILGRVNAPTTLPTPGKASGAVDGAAGGRATDSYVSPLPEQFTTFPVTTPDGQVVTAPRSLPFLQRLVFDDLPIRMPNGIRVDENLVRAEFTGNLVLSGTGAKPRLTGDIRSQRGFIYLRENEFTLSDSTITFSGENVFPSFDITANGTPLAATTRQRVPVTVNMSGKYQTLPDGRLALDLTTTLRCTVSSDACADPDTGVAYSEPELYALVATGVPNLTALPGQLGALGSSALQTALNVFVLGELERTLATAFGLDVLRLTPQLTGNNPLESSITLGSYITRELYLQYQVDLTGKGLLDATYSTADNRFTFRVSTPLTGLDLTTLRPSFNAAYNATPSTSFNIGVQNSETSTQLKFGITYRIGR